MKNSRVDSYDKILNISLPRGRCGIEFDQTLQTPYSISPCYSNGTRTLWQHIRGSERLQGGTLERLTCLWYRFCFRIDGHFISVSLNIVVSCTEISGGREKSVVDHVKGVWAPPSAKASLDIPPIVTSFGKTFLFKQWFKNINVASTTQH